MDAAGYQASWGTWTEREMDFFKESYRRVAPLQWSEVCAICGPDVRMFGQLTREAYSRVVSDDLPPVLRLRPFQTLHVGENSSEVVGYSPFESPPIAKETDGCAALF